MWWCKIVVEKGTRRDGDTVVGIYFRVFYFIVHFFKKYIDLKGLNSSPSRPIAVSPRHRFAVSCRRPFTASPCRRPTLAVWVIISLVAAGCGYHFAGTGRQAPGDIKSIAIDVLQNNTAEVGLQNVFTNEIVNEFVRWKKLPIKPSKEAEGVLGGSIAAINFRAISHVDSDKTLTTRVTITLKLTLKRVETDEILWRKNYSYYEDYVETGNALDTAILRRQATARIAEYLAQKIYMDMFEEF